MDLLWCDDVKGCIAGMTARVAGPQSCRFGRAVPPDDPSWITFILFVSAAEGG